jgi:hypothetical protein
MTSFDSGLEFWLECRFQIDTVIASPGFSSAPPVQRTPQPENLLVFTFTLASQCSLLQLAAAEIDIAQAAGRRYR